VSEEIRLSVKSGAVRGIREHSMEAYPHECCGALLGRDTQVREVCALLPLVNRRDDSPKNRFSLSAADVVAAEAAAESQGLHVVGWYHSHPDCPAQPSEYDREHALPWYSYVIVSVREGVARELTSWRLNDNRERYTEERVELQP